MLHLERHFRRTPRIILCVAPAIWEGWIWNCGWMWWCSQHTGNGNRAFASEVKWEWSGACLLLPTQCMGWASNWRECGWPQPLCNSSGMWGAHKWWRSEPDWAICQKFEIQTEMYYLLMAIPSELGSSLSLMMTGGEFCAIFSFFTRTFPSPGGVYGNV